MLLSASHDTNLQKELLIAISENFRKFTAYLFPNVHDSKPKSNHNTWIPKML